MGMVHAYQKGELDDASDTVKEIAKDIKPEDAEDFASTKHKGLPEKKEAQMKTDPNYSFGYAIGLIKRAGPMSMEEGGSMLPKADLGMQSPSPESALPQLGQMMQPGAGGAPSEDTNAQQDPNAAESTGEHKEEESEYKGLEKMLDVAQKFVTKHGPNVLMQLLGTGQEQGAGQMGQMGGQESKLTSLLGQSQQGGASLGSNAQVAGQIGLQ